MTRGLAVVCTLVTASLLLAGIVQAQNPLKADYISNANTTGAPDATFRLDNPGGASARDLCADIFVFDTNEELSECCSCLETPDGLRTLSVNTDLTAAPLTGVILTGGVIKIVAAASNGGVCPVPTSITTLANGEVKSWATHIQDNSFDITEAASQDSYLSSAEQSTLARQCGAIMKTSSPNGICSCGSGS
jgi:hypothetical protein